MAYFNKNIYVLDFPETIEERIQRVSKENKPKKELLRKTPTKEEKNKMEFEAMLHYNDSVEEEPVVEETHEEKEWDVPKDLKITFFDPSLSYELTGYRPITKDKGLDFNPKDFTVAADAYRKNGRYTSLQIGTFKHNLYWKQEFDKCQHGVTIGKYTLTGQNYFFLNYYRLLSPVSEDESGTQRSEDFPIFIAKQYEYFHYLELCKKAGFDGLAFKSRGVGASEIAASNCAHAFTFFRQSYNIVTAFAEEYVKKTLEKVWQELNFLDTCTETAFKRLKQKTDTVMKKVASKVDRDGVEFGWKSTIEGITSDTADKLRGNRVENIYFEESGNNKCLIDTYERGRALVNILGKRVGNMFVFGTSGEQGPQLEGIKKMFYNPSGYRILPFYNTSMANLEPQLTGYFIPSYSMWFGDDEGTIGYDSRGVVFEDLAKEHYLKEWSKIEDPKALLINKAEYCFTPEDAFILEGENRFDREKLSDQLAQIEIHKTVDKPTRCKLRWPMKGDIPDRQSRPFVKFEATGKILLVEEPILDGNGIPFPNLYCSGIDGVDLDSTTSTGQDDVSQFCMVIMRRQFGLQPPKVVAIYKDRPANIKEAFDNALKLCLYYNCKALVEATRISIKLHFEHYNALNYLMHRPKATANTSSKTNFRQYGVPATPAIIEHQLDLIEQYISDYCDIINFPEMLDELLRYSYANKRKFDIVAAFGICLLADEEMIGKTVRTEPQLKKLQDVGYYRDQYGRVQFGIVKKDEISTLRYGWTRTNNY